MRLHAKPTKLCRTIRDRKLVLGIGMRVESVSKVGEGHVGRKMEMRKEGD